jgi:hypothetical protein
MNPIRGIAFAMVLAIPMWAALLLPTWWMIFER